MLLLMACIEKVSRLEQSFTGYQKLFFIVRCNVKWPEYIYTYFQDYFYLGWANRIIWFILINNETGVAIGQVENLFTYMTQDQLALRRK